MADVKISNLTTDSSPDRTADYAPTYDASAVATKKVLLSDFGIYPMMFYFSNLLSPADSSTYYLSPYSGAGLVAGSSAHRLYVPRTGKIIKAFVSGGCTTGTSETSTISVRLNDTTDTTIVSTLAFNASPVVFSNTSMSVAVTANTDFLNIKWATPAWATNPTNVSFSVTLWIA